jgi:hypothetical protein
MLRSEEPPIYGTATWPTPQDINATGPQRAQNHPRARSMPSSAQGLSNCLSLSPTGHRYQETPWQSRANSWISRRMRRRSSSLAATACTLMCRGCRAAPRDKLMPLMANIGAVRDQPAAWQSVNIAMLPTWSVADCLSMSCTSRNHARHEGDISTYAEDELRGRVLNCVRLGPVPDVLRFAGVRDQLGHLLTPLPQAAYRELY